MTELRDLMSLKYREAILHAADLEGIPDRHALGLVAVESRGRHIYSGSDGPDAVLSGYPYEVDLCNFRVFCFEVQAGRGTTTGVGLVQITYWPYFAEMLEVGLKPWEPLDNCRWGFRIHRANKDRTGSWREAYARYNGGPRPKPISYVRADAYLETVRLIGRIRRGAA